MASSENPISAGIGVQYGVDERFGALGRFHRILDRTVAAEVYSIGEYDQGLPAGSAFSCRPDWRKCARLQSGSFFFRIPSPLRFCKGLITQVNCWRAAMLAFSLLDVSFKKLAVRLTLSHKELRSGNFRASTLWTVAQVLRVAVDL